MALIGRDTRITWYGHATFVIETPGGKRLMIDPWVKNNPSCPDHLKTVDKLDALLITHGHYDHIQDLFPIVEEARPNTIVGIFEIYLWLARKGIDVLGMNKGGSALVEGVKVTMLHADHSCGIQEDDGSIIYGGEAVSYLLEMENGFKIFHSGDTALFGDMRLYGELFSPDLAILPIGDLYTMDPRQAAYAAEMLGVKQVVPSHFGTYPALEGTPEKLKQELSRRGYECEVLAINPGETLS